MLVTRWGFHFCGIRPGIASKLHFSKAISVPTLKNFCAKNFKEF